MMLGTAHRLPPTLAARVQRERDGLGERSTSGKIVEHDRCPHGQEANFEQEAAPREVGLDRSCGEAGSEGAETGTVSSIASR
jgi:hypothetical protein